LLSQGHTNRTKFNFSDGAARAAYVRSWSGLVHDYGYDGLSLDMEGGIPSSQGDGLTALVQEFRRELGPAAQLSFATECQPRARFVS
jgi:chitinase